jgi:single-strand DNA-binding protein
MSDTITLTGLVATTPRHVVTSEGLAITNFRLASTHKRYDSARNVWLASGTNWYTITAFGQLADNVIKSVEKGQQVIVYGIVRIRDWESGSHTGTNVEIDAQSIGHDLACGNATFTRGAAVQKETVTA